jgi:predicted extracellular nuclease
MTAEACGFTYTVTHLESADGRGIDVALLSDPNRVEIDDYQLRQTCAPFETGIFDKSVACRPGDDPLFSRPPLQVSLTLDGEPYTVFVNHFKSKRGGEAETAPRRLLQAQRINALVDEILAQDAQAQIIVMGDFNDYELSPAMREMTENGRLTNILLQVPDEGRYSFVFAGISQLIDGVLVSPALADEVAQVQIMHVNADYPDSMGLDISPEGLPYKATDHDVPVVVFGVDEVGVVTTVPGETAVSPTPEASPAPVKSDSGGLLWLVLGGVVLLVMGGGVMWWKRGR